MNGNHLKQYLRLVNLGANEAADLLSVKSRQLRRWLNEGAPDGIQAELENITGVPCNPVVDKFVIGSGLTSGDGAEKVYLAHTEYPRFICTVNREFNKDRPGYAFARGNRNMQDFVMIDMAASHEITEALDIACSLMDDANIAVF